MPSMDRMPWWDTNLLYASNFSISRYLRQGPPTTEHLGSQSCLVSQRLCLTVGESWKEEQVLDYLDLLVHRQRYCGCQASGDILRRRIRVVLGGDQRLPGRLLRVSLTGGSNDWLLYNTHAIASARPSRHHPSRPRTQEKACASRKVSFWIYTLWLPPLIHS